MAVVVALDIALEDTSVAQHTAADAAVSLPFPQVDSVSMVVLNPPSGASPEEQSVCTFPPYSH